MKISSIINRVRAASSILVGGEWENANHSKRRRTPQGGRPRDWSVSLTSAARGELVRRSRYLQKNSGFYEEAAGDMALYSVGTGIRPQSMADDEEWQKQSEQYFNDWSMSCDITRRFDMTEVGNLASRAIDVDGEFFALRVRNLSGEPRLQLLETHRLQDITDPGRMIFSGVQVSAYGAPLNFYFKRNDGEDLVIPAFAVSHIFEPRWSSALRNPPTLQHGLNHLLDAAELLAMEKHGVKDILEVSRVLKSDRPEAIADGDFMPAAEEDDEEEDGGTDPKEITKVLGGRTVRIDTNEELSPFESDRPSPTFQGFLEYLLRDTAAGGIPYEILRDPSKLGGAVVRLMVGKTDRRVEARKRMLIKRLYQPAWFYVIGDAIDRGLLAPVPGWWRVKWTGQKRITVDAGRDEREARNDLELGRKSFEQDFVERGMDFDEQLKIRKRNARSLMRAAGIPDSEPIPMWMLYKPTGQVPTVEQNETDKEDE